MRRALFALVAIAGLALVVAPTAASAQCAVCGNPAFSAGDNDIGRAFGDGSPSELRLSAGVVYSYLNMSDLYTGTTRLPEADKTQFLYTPEWSLRVHMITVMAGLELPSGTSFQAILPMGRADTTKVDDTGKSKTLDEFGSPLADTQDYGVSDLELRVRQRINGLVGLTDNRIPQVVVSVGVAAPTGNFIVKDSAGAATDQYVSLGRGTWWVLADLDLFGRINDTFGWSLTNGARVPLTDNVNPSDGYLFRWGPEFRSTLSANFALIPGTLNAAVGAEMQWRDSGKERIATGLEIADFPNGGGTWVGVNPTVQWVIGKGISATATVRLPVYRDVNGQQPVPGLGGVLALNWSWDTAPPKSAGPTPALLPGQKPSEPEVAKLLVPGKTVLVEYGASWCKVCKRLKPKLHAFAESREDVVLRYVDVTDWPVEKMKRVLPAQPGLPVLDVYDGEGKLIRRLWGEGAFAYGDVVPAAK